VLLRTGRPQAVLDHVGRDFVARRVADGHPYPAVSDSLEVVAAAAAELRHWPALAACGEHAGVAISAYEDKLQSPRLFTEIYAAAHGADALAARLLFEVRPTWPRRVGMQICLACDQAGRRAAMKEHLTLSRLSARTSLVTRSRSAPPTAPAGSGACDWPATRPRSCGQSAIAS
jgi:hypothetical protein